MKAIEALQNRMDQSFEKLRDYLDSLSARERVLVIFTTIFVVVAAVSSALWYMHQAADTQQKRLNQLKDTIVWMQSNAVTIESTAGGTATRSFGCIAANRWENSIGSHA